jgi:hypothetical protein
MLRRIFPALLAALVAPALAAAAEGWKLFLPRSIDTGAFIELYGVSERDEYESYRGKVSWQDDFLREKLTLFSNGYVYHPRFMIYHAEVAGALKQEWFEASYVEPIDRRDNDAYEYDFRLVFLPEHDYNFEVFALRYEPLLKEQWAVRRTNVNTSYGADFRYRRKPWFFHTRFDEESTEYGESTTDVTRLGVDGMYYKDLANGGTFSVDAAFNPSRYETSTGLEGESDDARVGNLLDFGRWRLSSNVSWNQDAQRGTTDRRDIESDQFLWWEQLTAYLPYHLRAELGYRWQDSENRLPLPDGGTRIYDSRTQDLDFDLIHKLYLSLESTYSFRYGDQTSSAGESASTSHGLNFNYSKEIPARSRIIANLGGARTDFESKGQVSVVEEGHPATPVPGSFVLARQNIDRATVRVTLRSPLPPNELIELVERVHYTLTPAGAGLELMVFALPPQFVVPGTYEIRVSYVLDDGSYELTTDTLSHSVSVELFDQLLTPYYSYSELRSRTKSGYYGGGDLDSTTFTAGLIFRWRQFRLLAEYENIDWQVSPYESWRGELQVTGNLGPYSNYYFNAAHRIRTYPDGRPGAVVGEYEETTSSASGSINRQLFRRRLVVSLGGSFSRLDGLVVNDAYSVNGSASWRVGKLDFTLGASIFDTQTEGSFLVESQRTHEYYYLKLRRFLF